MAFSWAPDGSIVASLTTPIQGGEGVGGDERGVSNGHIGDDGGVGGVSRAQDWMAELRTGWQPPSVAALVVSSHETFKKLHSRFNRDETEKGEVAWNASKHDNDEGVLRSRRRRRFINQDDIMRASVEYRSHLSRCVLEIEREAAAEAAAADASSSTGSVIKEAPPYREPVAYRVEYWRRCLEIWHFCEILFVGDSTSVSREVTTPSTDLVSRMDKTADDVMAGPSNGGRGDEVISHDLILWILSYYANELHSTPLYQRDDRAATTARLDGQGSGTAAADGKFNAPFNELDAVEELKLIAAMGLGGDKRDVQAAMRASDPKGSNRGKRRARLPKHPEQSSHYWPMVCRFASRADFRSAAQLLQLHSYFPHQWLDLPAGQAAPLSTHRHSTRLRSRTAPGGGKDANGTLDTPESAPRFSPASLLWRARTVLLAMPSTVFRASLVLPGVDDESDSGEGSGSVTKAAAEVAQLDTLAALQTRRERWRQRILSLLSDVEAFAGTGAISGEGVGVGGATRAAASVRPLQSLCRLLLGEEQALNQHAWRWYHRLLAYLLYRCPMLLRGESGAGRSKASLAFLLEMSLRGHDTALGEGAAVDELGFGYLSILKDATDQDVLLAIQDAHALFGSSFPFLPAHLTDLLVKSYEVRAWEEEASFRMGSTTTPSAFASAAPLSASPLSFVIPTQGLDLREYFLRSWASAVRRMEVFPVEGAEGMMESYGSIAFWTQRALSYLHMSTFIASTMSSPLFVWCSMIRNRFSFALFPLRCLLPGSCGLTC